ncbi:MBL fold metallo-hydrolase [Octadecabacter sp. G9-8]|uniref:MBL fold metallo-hydrolase n=1 Tax=Octadecabacter dasysiphoniae TaxID=2909341 RepID=A0ABS9D0T2_9RHOB|nr:MBL fold metallo-hydrolase [Octadecabacter dasysiphoniae]MCF2872679.1 MBL fold metallo-hydrolase [Octadecabacter dasysiphoniae]
MNQSPPKAGVAVQLEPDLACLLAPNPSPMTYWGTNTYLLGHDSIAVIDPGPLNDAHMTALIGAIGGRRVSHILVTHSHLDHSPLARPLSDATGAPIFAFGNSDAGRSDVMTQLAQTGLMGGGEGVDTTFRPDETLRDGDDIRGDGWAVCAHHTPGHFGNHMCFTHRDVGFSGDLVMGWATSLVSPPDGDLTDFMSSCATLADTGITRAYAGHGAPIPDAQSRIADLISHRKSRETQILAALAHGPATPATLTAQIYTDTAPALINMAQRNVLAHLVDLSQRAIVAPMGPLSAVAKYALTKC